MKLLHNDFHTKTALWLTIALSACNLNRTPVVWVTNVEPQFVCPGEGVTLSWSTNGDGVTTTITSDPPEALGSPIISPYDGGENGSLGITGLTSFTFSASGGPDIRNPVTHFVDVVLPERESFVPLDFEPACSGNSVVWQPVDVSIPEFRSEGVRLVRVCNTSGEVVQLTLTFGSGPMTWTLVPGRCTEDLPPDLGRVVLGAQVNSIGAVPGVRCDTSLSMPSPIDMVAALACDLMSTAAPIVIASPETPVPEETQSGIIPLWTETPNPAGFILVVQVPANCRQGPGVVYPVVNSVLPGKQVQVIGKSADNAWWYGRVDNDQCFISNIAGVPSGDLNLLPVIPAPPVPVPTKTEVPQQQEQPTAITEIDFDQDGYGVSVDCNDKDAKINPGAFETPDDKVDSNCNGDDDT